MLGGGRRELPERLPDAPGHAGLDAVVDAERENAVRALRQPQVPQRHRESVPPVPGRQRQSVQLVPDRHRESVPPVPVSATYGTWTS